ncbi:MAG TPA: DNA polymerase II, partial [Thermoplasmata archaeon]|nr:DNA polymerase II [Thermoplasmata archaeon]
VIPGMRVSWIVTDSRKSPQEVEPWVDGRPFTKQPDWDYYADRVAQTLARVTEVFDWDAASLLRGSHQQRLASPPETPRSTDSNATPATLDTPISDVGKPAKRRSSTRSLTDWQ